MKAAVIYVRVSSKEQKEGGFSIPAQRKLLVDYARRNGLKVLREFEDVETAKRAGREAFLQMLSFLKQHSDCRDVLVEKTDRLYRNIRDWLTLDELGLVIHLVKEGEILSEKSRSHQKFIHGIKVLMAKNFLDNLSEETSKGMLEKAEQGLWPSFAPLGYVNNRDNGMIEPDPVKGPLVRMMFERYAAETPPVRELIRWATEAGLRGQRGGILALSTVVKMLTNRIYAGEFVWKGVTYQGRHEPLVSRELFEEVGGRIRGKSKPRERKHRFAFRGLLRCGGCGAMVTAEIIKGKYVYYRCTRSRGKCREKAVREERLVELLGEPLRRLRMTQERREWVLQALRESHRDQQAYEAQRRQDLGAMLDDLDGKLDAVYRDKLDGVIDAIFWRRQHEALMARKATARGALEALDRAKGDYLESGAKLIEIAQDAYRLYLTMTDREKRKLLQMLVSNCWLEDQAVRVELRKPFQIIADGVAEEKRMRREKRPESAVRAVWRPQRESNPCCRRERAVS